LGRAFAVECASRGWDLFLTDLNEASLSTLSERLESTYGVTVMYEACDLVQPAERSRLIDRLAFEQVHLWSLINVAGIDHEGLFHHQALTQIRTILRLNIEATVELIHSAIEFRDPLQTFRILNVASLAAYYPMPVKATYAASKRFLLDFSLALREEVRDLGATVSVLCPAGMPTTPENIRAIEAQGWMGQVTTCNTGAVANAAIECMLKGKATCIPGGVNRLLQLLGSLAPASLVAHMIGLRWSRAHQKPVAADLYAEAWN
jgi:short-subunit dehydrogenase